MKDKEEQYRYIRSEGGKLATNVMHAKGVFSMCLQLVRLNVMDPEDPALFRETEE